MQEQVDIARHVIVVLEDGTYRKYADVSGFYVRSVDALMVESISGTPINPIYNDVTISFMYQDGSLKCDSITEHTDEILI